MPFIILALFLSLALFSIFQNSPYFLITPTAKKHACVWRSQWSCFSCLLNKQTLKTCFGYLQKIFNSVHQSRRARKNKKQIIEIFTPIAVISHV